MPTISHRAKRSKRGISTAIVAMLSLILVVIIVGNVVLWSYQMNQFDWERTQESFKINDVHSVEGGTLFNFSNDGPLTVHIISIWINNATNHERYDVSIFINSAVILSQTESNLILPNKPYSVKMVSERGNIAVFVND